MYRNTKPCLWSALLVAAVASPFLASTALADGINLQRASVETHPSQGDVQDVPGSHAQLVRSADGVFLTMKTSDLTPGNAYTLWLVAINAPENCKNTPCTSTDVMELTDAVQSDLGFGDGVIVGSDGEAHFAAFQSIGEMDRSWFGHGLQRETAEIHAVLRDHGPLQEGLEPSMLSTFRGGCSKASVPSSLPKAARADGPSGNYDCSNVQMVIFEP